LWKPLREKEETEPLSLTPKKKRRGGGPSYNLINCKRGREGLEEKEIILTHLPSFLGRGGKGRGKKKGEKTSCFR